VVFAGVANTCAGETPYDAHYVYTEAVDRSGSMDFSIQGNIHNANENKPALEVVAVRSRWLADGTGRSDMRISGGEVTTDLQHYLPNSNAQSVDVVECWDTSFVISHTDTTPDELEGVMDHAPSGDVALCPYAEAEFAGL
jgi:hypothetical protein